LKYKDNIKIIGGNNYMKIIIIGGNNEL